MNKIIPIVTAIIGVILAIIGAVILWGVMPGAIRNKVADEMYIRNNTHNDAYKRFEKLPINLKWKIWFFNITNADKFDGVNINSLNFQEVGPYVYDEIRERVDINFDPTLDTVTFSDNKTYIFNEKESKGLKPTDKMTLVHLGLALNEKYLAIEVFRDLIKGFTMTDTVQNIAFDGVAEIQGQSLFTCKPCLSASKTVSTGRKDINQLGQYLDYGFSVNRTNKFWDETHRPGHCNDLRGTDGTQFHPDIKSGEVLTVYEPMLCRAIKFKKALDNVKPEGISTLRFIATDDNFAHTEENQCFCYEKDLNDCPAGLMNLQNCPPANLIAPAEVLSSQPYYLSNQALLNESGLAPLAATKKLTVENYGTILDIEPYTGLALGARKRVQLNVLLKKGTHNAVKNLAKKKMIAPLVWIEEAGDVDHKNAEELNSKVFAPKNLVTGFMIALMALGVLVVAIAGGCAYFKR